MYVMHVYVCDATTYRARDAKYQKQRRANLRLPTAQARPALHRRVGACIGRTQWERLSRCTYQLHPDLPWGSASVIVSVHESASN